MTGDILTALSRLADLNPEHLDPWTTFLPLSMHRRALQNDCIVVLGARGTGKTALFTLLQDAPSSERLRQFFEEPKIPDARWFDAFSQTGTVHPEVGTLEAFASRASDTTLRLFWLTHLLRRATSVAPDAIELPSELTEILNVPVAQVEAWCPRAERHAGLITATLDRMDGALLSSNRTLVAAYDTLDRIAQFDREIRRRFIGTLMSLWLSLSTRFKQLRGKLFLRNDLFDASELGFPDASKLRPRSIALDWDRESLFRLLVRHLARDPETRAWLADVRGLALREHDTFGPVPGPMPDKVQQAFTTRLAGNVIGKGVLKTSTARWIVSRLQDAHARITPRAFLWFFGFAASEALTRAGGTKRLTPTDLLTSLRKTSQVRVDELCEEYPLVTRIENLREELLPLELGYAVSRLGKPRVGEPRDLPDRGDIIVDELRRLGVLRLTGADKLDVPDIYRYRFALSPDYGAAWRQFIESSSSDAIEQLMRDPLTLEKMLRTMPWGTVAQSKIPNLDPDITERSIENALSLLPNAPNPYYEAHYRSRLGALRAIRRPEQAMPELERAAALFRQLGLKAWLGWTLSWITVADRSPEVLRNIEREASDDPVLAGCVLASRAVLAAVPATELVLEAIRRLPDQPELDWLRAPLYLTLAQGAERSGRVPAALSLAAIAVHLYPDPFYKESLAAIAARHGSLDADIERVRNEAAPIYARDRGWSLIHSVMVTDPLSGL